MADKPHAIRNDLNRRAREVGIFDQELTLQDLAAVRAFYDYTCLNPECRKTPATSIDHVKPLSQGGENTRQNLQLLCSECNKSKKDQNIDYRQGKVCPPDYSAPEPEQPEKTYKKHDWLKYENEYISTNISMRELSRKYNVDLAQIGDYASANNWVEKRQQNANEMLTRVNDLVSQARAEHNVATMDLLDVIISQGMQEMASGKAKVTPSAAIEAAKFKTVVQGGPDHRLDNVIKDWRDVARDLGVKPEDVIAEFDQTAASAESRYDSDSGAPRFNGEETGAGWTD